MHMYVCTYISEPQIDLGHEDGKRSTVYRRFLIVSSLDGVNSRKYLRFTSCLCETNSSDLS